MDKKKLNDIIQKFLEAYENEYSNYILVEDTAKAYLFKYLVDKIDKKYIVLTEFRIEQNKKFDIVIIEKKNFDGGKGDTINEKEIYKLPLIAVIEIKANLKQSSVNQNRFKHDLEKLSKTKKSTNKFFICLNCEFKLKKKKEKWWKDIEGWKEQFKDKGISLCENDEN